MKMLIKIFNHIKLIIFLHLGRLKSFFIKVNNLETPDRDILEKIIFPEICKDSTNKKILFVGCEWYTSHYKKFFINHDFWTIDFNKSVARFGSDNHIIDRLENLDMHFPDGCFDIIICNGILGFGTDSPVNTKIAFDKCFASMKTGGLFILGWNSNHEKKNDPREINSLGKFTPYIFPNLKTDRYYVNKGSSHIFDFYLKS